MTATGTYQLTLAARDSELSGSASVTVEVTEPVGPIAVTETITGSFNKKFTSRSATTLVAAGPASAVVQFAEGGGAGGGRNKKSSPAATEYTLMLQDGSGTVVAVATGAGPLRVSESLPAGSYTWTVSGPSGSFELTVTYLR